MLACGLVLRSVERNFIVITKPFALRIGVAVDPHKTAVARGAEDLDHGADLIHKHGDRSSPLPNDHSITNGWFTYGWR